MRDRLIELLKKADENASNKMITDYEDAIADNADFLLANGVIVPPIPLKVGDKIYRKMCRGFNDFFVREETVWIVDNHATAGIEIITKYVEPKGITIFPKVDIDNIGKTVFLTKEEAEKARAERNYR